MLVGLTGGIAGGKTTVARIFANLGAFVIDADQISRDVVGPKSAGLNSLVALFGSGILERDGQLDRKALGTLVFGDAEARAQLEGLLHPLIAQESARRITQALAQKYPLVIYDAALLVETGRADHFRPLVVVDCPPHVQHGRLMARDGLDAAEAQMRIDAQMPIAHKTKVADYIIDNGGTPMQTTAQVEGLWSLLTQGNREC